MTELHRTALANMIEGIVGDVDNADEPELFIPVGPPMKPFKNDRKTR